MSSILRILENLQRRENPVSCGPVAGKWGFTAIPA
jgi:hypothetical protein